MGLIRWIIAIVVLSAWIALCGTALYVAMYEDDGVIPAADVIVVLAGDSDQGGMNGQTMLRLEKGVEVYNAQEGDATFVVTGGGEPPVAEAMREAAIEAGVPEENILVEAASHSTLQNALFTADFEQLDKSAPTIIVTHRYHLPRAWASFRWAGFTDVSRVAADPDAGFNLTASLLWESIKWPLNVVRAAAASAAMAGDVPRENYLKYLE